MPLDCSRPITQSEYDEIWDEAKERGEVFWNGLDIEHRQSIPKQLGQGEERIIELQPGLEIHISTRWYCKSLCLDYWETPQDTLVSNYYLMGSHRIINPGIQIEDDREEKAGETCLSYLSEVRSIEHYPAEQPFKNLQVILSLDRLRSFGLVEDHSYPLLRPLTQGKTPKSFHQSLKHITPAMQHVLQQILDCPYHGTIKRMYLESKAIELLALQFHKLSEVNGLGRIVAKLSKADIERLNRAREILQQRFEDPPSLMGLARHVGLNDFKLKQGFRYLFNTTVFGYVQSCRMKQAQELLCDRDLSIAEIAVRVGYASRSRFHNAFKRHMDMTPNDYRRQFGT